MNDVARRHRWSLFALVSAGVLAMVGLCAIPYRSLQAQQENPPAAAATADPTAPLVERQAQLAAKALDLIAKSIDMGAPVFTSSQDTVVWSRELAGCQIYLSLANSPIKTQDPEVYFSFAKGPPNNGRITAFQEHASRMKILEERYLPLYQRGDISAFNFAKIEAARLQADIWLSREKNRK